MVVSEPALASEAGLHILRSGGNGVDVPVAISAGRNGCMLFYDALQQQVECLALWLGAGPKLGRGVRPVCGDRVEIHRTWVNVAVNPYFGGERNEAGRCPLKRSGQIVGAMGVSGGSGDQDHSIAEGATGVRVALAFR
jgi:hypothetical protein